MTCLQIISLRSVIVFQTIVRQIFLHLVNDLRFYKMQTINIYSRRCTFATLTVPVTYPFIRLTWHRFQEHVVYSPCVPEGMSHRFISATDATGFSPRAGVIMNIKRSDLLFDNKLSIIVCIFFVFFFAYFLLKRKNDQYE